MGKFLWDFWDHKGACNSGIGRGQEGFIGLSQVFVIKDAVPRVVRQPYIDASLSRDYKPENRKG